MSTDTIVCTWTSFYEHGFNQGQMRDLLLGLSMHGSVIDGAGRGEGGTYTGARVCVCVGGYPPQV